MYDANAVLQAKVTKTTGFTSTALDLLTGTPRRGLKARFIVFDYHGASAGHTWTPIIEGSAENTTFFIIAEGAPTLVTTTASQTTEMFVPFETSYRYVRARMDVNGTTGTPQMIYSADVGLSRPG